MSSWAQSTRRNAPRLGALVLMLVAMSPRATLGHEGHKPLPTKGAQVDLETGIVTLSRQAFDGLGVETVEIEQRAVADKILAYARLVTPWQQHALVTTRLPGRIEKLHVQPGQTVVKGQTLAEVSSLELENLQLELLTAQTELRLSRTLLEQMETVAQGGSIPEKDVRSIRAQNDANVQALEIARSKARAMGLRSDDIDRVLREQSAGLLRTLPIVSPIAGVVTHADVAVGKVVAPTEHLFEVRDPSKVWAKIEILERDLGRVAVGQAVELSLTAYPDETFHAQVERLDNSFDDTSHLGTAWATLSNPPGQAPRFLPGMFGHAELSEAGPSKLAAPAKAVLTDGIDQFVLVEQAATAKGFQFQKRNVMTGRRAAGLVQISGDVYPGDRVMTTGAHELAAFFVQGVLRPGPEARKNLRLQVETVARHSVGSVVELDGAVKLPPGRIASASARVDGTLQSILVDRGQSVRAGEVIARIASPELQRLQLELLRAQFQLGFLRESMDRLRTLDERRVVAQRQLWETESQLVATQNQSESLKNQLFSLGLTAEQIKTLLEQRQLIEALPVRAPIDGSLTSFNKTLGQVIRAEEPLFEIQDLSAPLVEAYVSERDLRGIRVGQSVRARFVAAPSYVGEGAIVRSAQAFEAESRAQSVWVELRNPPGVPLRQGMLARLSVTTQEAEPSLAVPLEAIAREGTRDYVFVEKTDGSFERRAVATGRADDRLVEITSGLAAGERIATRGAARLQTAFAAVR